VPPVSHQQKHIEVIKHTRLAKNKGGLQTFRLTQLDVFGIPLLFLLLLFNLFLFNLFQAGTAGQGQNVVLFDP
jgi:hypothetical protein